MTFAALEKVVHAIFKMMCLCPWSYSFLSQIKQGWILIEYLNVQGDRFHKNILSRISAITSSLIINIRLELIEIEFKISNLESESRKLSLFLPELIT